MKIDNYDKYSPVPELSFLAVPGGRKKSPKWTLTPYHSKFLCYKTNREETKKK